MKSLYEHFTELARTQGKKPALLVCRENGTIVRTYTREQMKENIECMASWLRFTLGLKPQEAVGLALSNSVELLFISWAAWAAGVMTVPLDVKRDTLSSRLYKINLANVKTLVVEQHMFNNQDVQKLKKAVHVVEPPGLETISMKKKWSVEWQKSMSHSALVLFTSGTTGLPKGAELTLENLWVNAKGIQEWFGISSRDRFLVLLPLYHINSTVFCFASLLGGASIAVVPGYSNSHFWNQLANTKSTFTSIVPTICYDQIFRKKEFEEVKHKLCVSRIQIGSAPVVAEDVQKFMKQFRVEMYQGYGQTETALRVTGVPMGLSKTLYKKLVQENSIGKPMNWADVKVMDAKGNMLGEGQEGEIAVKGLAVMKGYIKHVEANQHAFNNAYFLTGDLGFYRVIDGIRYFFLKGRIKEIIIKGGVNLSPVAIENKLKHMSRAIDQVYVVGFPDRRYGEEPAAVICWKKTGKSTSQLEAELQYQLTSFQKNLAAIEIPKYIATISSRVLPITSTGKVQRSFLSAIILPHSFKDVYLVALNNTYQFMRLTPNQKPFMKQALDLFNHCWNPLVIDERVFFQQAQNGIVLIAIDKKNIVRGVLTILRTSLSEEQLGILNYSEVTQELTLSANDEKGNAIVCVSICTSNYDALHTLQKCISYVPTMQEMETYLQSGKDVVYNFHKKPKGGLRKGAALIKILPNSRPEDIMSLGYNMLLKYPSLSKVSRIAPNAHASLAVQLIEAAMAFAQQLGISNVYAFSRPAGALAYFAK